ncbi:MAG: YibE/F family protein [Candidatus Peregrinibacteria bacterium GW2011_GWF2_38_29]|nr:MAG: YibE/F family protein [Candidatus Peregrinibacteria bacterium GW2011_GWF2_38_29]HBB02188.1 hypothetical protein [Candidatus Peregrinibacteria bacterium]
MEKKKFVLTYVVVGISVLILMSVIPGQSQKFFLNEQGDKYIHEFIHGEVQRTMPLLDEDEVQVLGVKVNSGKEKGEMISAPVSSMNNFNTYSIGDEVQIYKMTDTATGSVSYETADYYHQDGIQWVFVIFAVIAIVIARKKGLTAILSIIISLILFYFVFLKMIMAGYSPLIACFLFVFIVTALTIPLIHGFNKKSLSAMLAILIGYFFSILISFVFKNIVQLGNVPDEEFRMLGAVYPNIGLSDILIASLFMGAIGALIDTAISISSAIFEALKGHLNKTFGQVYKVGMEVGKDVLGSMINTLLFAYLASSLPFLIIVSLSKGSSLIELVNMDFIALELTRTFIGAISLVVLIPITASISAYYFTKIKK